MCEALDSNLQHGVQGESEFVYRCAHMGRTKKGTLCLPLWLSFLWLKMGTLTESSTSSFLLCCWLPSTSKSAVSVLPRKCPSPECWVYRSHHQLRVRHPWSVWALSSRFSGIRQVPRCTGLIFFASLKDNHWDPAFGQNLQKKMSCGLPAWDTKSRI